MVVKKMLLHLSLSLQASGQKREQREHSVGAQGHFSSLAAVHGHRALLARLAG